MGARSPHKPKRNAKRSSRKGEQTVETNHPVDGSPERLCGPPGGTVPDRTSLTAESFKRGHFSPSKHPCPATEGSVRDLPCSNREPGARSICGQRVHSRTEPKSPSDSSGSELDGSPGISPYSGKDFAEIGGLSASRNHLGWEDTVCFCLTGPQKRSGVSSTGWNAFSVCSPFPVERSAFLFWLVGASRPHTPSQAFEKA